MPLLLLLLWKIFNYEYHLYYDIITILIHLFIMPHKITYKDKVE